MARTEIEPRARLVLLGASNVRRVLPELLREARWRLGGPLQVLVSHGNGRSYLGASSFLGRGLDKIAPEPFWAFEADADVPTFALVADAGNDLAYGSPPEPVAEAIERVVARLARRGARTVILGLPLASLESVGALRFGLTRTLFFPTRRVDRSRLLEAARDLDRRLAAIARAHGAAFVPPRGDWYGLDPIHVRLRARAEASRLLFEGFGPRIPVAPNSLELGALGRLKPAAWTWFGHPARWPQPSAVLGDGTRVSWI
ncbi:MAG: hypothetical protein NTY35_15455 [Planctomycetota bacterium]|nr:hypothetical protein [Planctomycetota bacterium]